MTENNYKSSDITIKSESKKDEEITINDFYRKSLFYLFCIEYMISSSDGGIIPQQNTKIQIDFEDIDGDSRVGLFGSIDFIGRIAGSIVMSILINKLNRKIFFSGCCFLKAITLIIALFTGNYYINLFSRLLSGVPQTLLTSYGTIWTDQFGRRNKRSMMLPLFQFSSLLGIMAGYGLGIICDVIVGEESKFHGWRLSFMIEGIILAVLGMIFIFYPKLYFSSTFYLNEGDDYKGKEKSIEEIERHKSNSILNIFNQLPKILLTKIFMFMSIGNSVAFFGMRVIQFYADKYMELVLDVKDAHKFIYYIVLCLTGPIFGILICAIIITKIGGYESKNGLIFILVLNIFGSIISLFITISLNTFISLGSSWLYLFCLAAATPLQGGVILSSLPKELKASGYSINVFFLNILGSFPSSYVFALICDFIRDNYPEEENMRYRTTMRITMFYNFFGLFLIILGIIFIFRLKGEFGSSKNNKKEKEEEKGEEKGEEKDDMKQKLTENQEN